MLDMVSWLIFGFIAGALGKVLIPGKDPYMVYVAIILGTIGALIGGFIGRISLGYGKILSLAQLFRPGVLMSLILAAAGALALLIAYRLISRTNF